MGRKKKIALVILIVGVAAGLLIPMIILGQFVTAAKPMVTHDWINLDKIASISKFRSCQGHEYGNDGMDEGPSSMKHYYNPLTPHYNHTNNAVEVYACFDGTVMGLQGGGEFTGGGEGRGYTFQLLSSQGFYAVYFHVNILDSVKNLARFKAGDLLGYADFRSTDPDWSSNVDIAMHSGWINRKAWSYFDVMNDDVFAGYEARGVTSRAQMKYTTDERATSPCTCSDYAEHGDCFFKNAPAEDWVVLTVPS